MVILTKLFHFEAAHFLPKMPEGHKCRRMHGHSFNIEIRLAGEPNAETGLLMDFGDVKEVVKPYIDMLDHWVINEVGERTNDELLQNPTSENIAKWFYLQLEDKLPMYSVVVHETCTSHCEYRKG